MCYPFRQYSIVHPVQYYSVRKRNKTWKLKELETCPLFINDNDHSIVNTIESTERFLRLLSVHKIARSKSNLRTSMKKVTSDFYLWSCLK